MQYLISVIDDKSRSGTPDEMARIDEFNERLRADGHWVFAGGLDSPGTAIVIDNRGETTVSVDGPFIESKDHFSGFWIIEAANLDLARKLAAEGSRSCNRKVELRPFLG